jgi:hypothetical protein
MPFAVLRCIWVDLLRRRGRVSAVVVARLSPVSVERRAVSAPEEVVRGRTALDRRSTRTSISWISRAVSRCVYLPKVTDSPSISVKAWSALARVILASRANA